MKNSYVYILTNKNKTVLYIGVTSDLYKRIYQHKIKMYNGFSSRYNCSILVFYEKHSNIEEAISREKQLKAGNRQRKIDLINKMNPEWKDLSDDFQFDFEF